MCLCVHVCVSVVGCRGEGLGEWRGTEFRVCLDSGCEWL